MAYSKFFIFLEILPVLSARGRLSLEQQSRPKGVLSYVFFSRHKICQNLVKFVTGVISWSQNSSVSNGDVMCYWLIVVITKLIKVNIDFFN